MLDTEADRAWREHEERQQKRWLALSYGERLAWLWQAKEFAQRAQGAARRAAQGPDGAGRDPSE